MGNKFSVVLTASLIGGTLFADTHLPSYTQHEQTYHQCVAADYQPYRILEDRDVGGHSFRTDDGAVWVVKDDTSKSYVRQWRTNDTMVIHPCFSTFWSGGMFYIENDRTRTSAVVDLALVPYTPSPTSVCIADINTSMSEIFVVDAYNRYFKFIAQPSDYSIYRNWQPGEYILFGSNEDCFSGVFSDHPYIIINVHRREYVRGTMVNY